MDKTIYATATPEGRGGISIIRISGPEALGLLQRVFKPVRPLQPGRLQYGHVGEGDTLDEAMAVYMKAPYTYTREDVCEIHTHGGPAMVAMVLKALGRAGGRLALPGEFTQRAFENGRIDLAEAEAVMDVISASSEKAALASAKQLSGSVSNRIREITASMIDAIASLEAALDYPEDEWEQQATQQGIEGMGEALQKIDSLLKSYAGGTMMRQGVRCALVGRPNAGKSTFLNAAAGFERAIVDEEPGTTRDTLEYNLQLDGNALCLLDTAGLRQEAAGVEKRGIELGLRRIREADVCILILDASEDIPEDLEYIRDSVGELPCIALLNKNDLPGRIKPKDERLSFAADIMVASALNNEGVEQALRRALQLAGVSDTEDVMLTNARHYEALRDAAAMLRRTIDAIEQGVFADIALIDAKCALDRLGEITGETAGQDVIDAIFRKFCLGK